MYVSLLSIVSTCNNTEEITSIVQRFVIGYLSYGDFKYAFTLCEFEPKRSHPRCTALRANCVNFARLYKITTVAKQNRAELSLVRSCYDQISLYVCLHVG